MWLRAKDVNVWQNSPCGTISPEKAAAWVGKFFKWNGNCLKPPSSKFKSSITQFRETNKKLELYKVSSVEIRIIGSVRCVIVFNNKTIPVNLWKLLTTRISIHNVLLEVTFLNIRVQIKLGSIVPLFSLINDFFADPSSLWSPPYLEKFVGNYFEFHTLGRSTGEGEPALSRIIDR